MRILFTNNAGVYCVCLKFIFPSPESRINNKLFFRLKLLAVFQKFSCNFELRTFCFFLFVTINLYNPYLVTQVFSSPYYHFFLLPHVALLLIVDTWINYPSSSFLAAGKCKILSHTRLQRISNTGREEKFTWIMIIILSILLCW